MLITFFNNCINEEILREQLPNVKIKSKKFVFTHRLRLKKKNGNVVPFLLKKLHMAKNFSFGVMYDLDIDEETLYQLTDVIYLDYKLIELDVYGFNSSVNEFIKNRYLPDGTVTKSFTFVGDESYKHMSNIKLDRRLNINYNKTLLNELLKGGLANELG
ncbi:MAG: hypothetical protein ACRC2K_13170 [Clostridium sp.]